MNVSVQLDGGGAMEFDHADFAKVCNGLRKATEMVIAQEDVLRACHHELTTLHGLIAHDGDPAQAWSLDVRQLLGQIAALLPPLPAVK